MGWGKPVMTWWNKNKEKVVLGFFGFVLVAGIMLFLLVLFGPLVGSYYCVNNFC